MKESPSRRLLFGLVFFALLFSGRVCGQLLLPEKNLARSISGQYIVRGGAHFSRLAISPRIAGDTNLVRLEPALLAISAERIKDSVWRRLEIKPDVPWRGQIYLVIHPARSLDESVTITSKRLANGWDYRVELPDVLSRSRFARALTGVVLLELANRGAAAHSAEIPAWLVDGFAGELLAAGSSEFILSSPNKMVNGLPVARLNLTERGLNPLAAAGGALKKAPALTVAELSWPTDDQLIGRDGGVYRASAQLFCDSLLDLKNGPDLLCAMLQFLPQFQNWQFAFNQAYRVEFPRPLDLEKWWALQVVLFTARDPGPGWTPEVSREKLDQILSVPVEMRTTSNSLPVHAEISLQAAIRSLDFAGQTAILPIKLRNLELAQFRVVPQFAALTDGYRRTLRSYLGERQIAPVSIHGRRPPFAPSRRTVRETLARLDALDAQRRTIETDPELRVPVQAAVSNR